MPALGFHELARLRLESISFFLAVFLISSGILCWLWNWIRADFSKLPRLTYPKACGIVGLWGLLFVIVLTMISGARELMTPGAWEKDGATYRLRGGENSDNSPVDQLSARRSRIAALSGALADFADRHGGRFPTWDEFDNLPANVSRVADAPSLSYAYLPGRSRDDDGLLLAFEPAEYADEPLALFTSGEIRQIPYDEIERRRASEGQ
jgi:hypothetical protein